MHSEENAMKGKRRLMCSGHEAMGTVNCRDCMGVGRGDGEGPAEQAAEVEAIFKEAAKRGEKRKARAGSIFALIGR